MKNNRTVRLIKSPKSPAGDYLCFVNEEGISQFETFKAKEKSKKMDEVGVENGSIKRTDLLVD